MGKKEDLIANISSLGYRNLVLSFWKLFSVKLESLRLTRALAASKCLC